MVECFAGSNAKARYAPTTTTTLDRNGADIRVGQSGATAIVQTFTPRSFGEVAEDDRTATLLSSVTGSGSGSGIGSVSLVVGERQEPVPPRAQAGTLLSSMAGVSRVGGMANESSYYVPCKLGGEVPQLAVRRLTVTECERLMGFPDGYTRISFRGKPPEKCPDTPRYKALGNSWAVPVVRWIGKRLDAEIRRCELDELLG